MDSVTNEKSVDREYCTYYYSAIGISSCIPRSIHY